jgi:hypothetical protein
MNLTQVSNINREVPSDIIAITDEAFTVQIGNQLFYIETWMDNQLDNFKPIKIPFFFIEELVIEETLESWNTKGYVVLVNDFEFFERGSYPLSTNKKNPTYKLDSPFAFRSDGRNKVYLKIFPIVKDIELPKEYWEMSFELVIYDIEDLKTDNSEIKRRKFYFQEERYQIMSERKLEWSTALYGPNQGNIDASDTQRSMPISDAIQSIIKAAASNDSDPNFSSKQFDSPKSEKPYIEVGVERTQAAILNGSSFNEKSSIIYEKTRFDNFDNDRWDKGVAGNDGMILYTSPTNESAIGDLNYVMNDFESENGGPVFLELDRHDVEGGKKFYLTSLKTLIQESSKQQVEHISVTDTMGNSDLPPYFPRADLTQEGTIKNFSSGIASRINDYKFVPMLPVDDLNLANTPSHNYDFESNQFNIFFKENTIEDAYNKIKEFAKEGLYSFKSKSSNAEILMNINKTKSSGLLTNNIHNVRKFFSTRNSQIHMLRSLCLLGQALYFRTLGLTNRSPGRFLFVDKDSSIANNNVFDDRFLGQWMILNVKHRFTKETYTTDVICSKLDTFNKHWDVKTDKY